MSDELFADDYELSSFRNHRAKNIDFEKDPGAYKNAHSRATSVDSSFAELCDPARTARTTAREWASDKKACVDMIVLNSKSQELLDTFMAEDLTSNATRIRFPHTSYEPEAVFARLQNGVQMKKIRYVHGDTVNVSIYASRDGRTLITKTSRRSLKITSANVVGFLFGPVSATFKVHRAKIGAVDAWKCFSVVCADRTLDFFTEGSSDMLDVIVATVALANQKEGAKTMCCAPMSKSTFLALKFRSKIDAMLEERGITLNELLLLAMYRTLIEGKYSDSQVSYVQAFIDKRFQQNSKMYRFVTQRLIKEKITGFKRKISKREKRWLIDEIRKRMLINKRTKRVFGIGLVLESLRQKQRTNSVTVGDSKELKILESLLYLENVRRNQIMREEKPKQQTAPLSTTCSPDIHSLQNEGSSDEVSSLQSYSERSAYVADNVPDMVKPDIEIASRDDDPDPDYPW